MRICLVFYDMQDFGGLEEYAGTLAIGLRKLGHQTSVLSAAWVPPGNQYRRRLRANGVPFVQVPKVLSHPASHWQTKVRVLQVLMVAASPVVFAAGSRCGSQGEARSSRRS